MTEIKLHCHRFDKPGACDNKLHVFNQVHSSLFVSRYNLMQVIAVSGGLPLACARIQNIVHAVCELQTNM